MKSVEVGEQAKHIPLPTRVVGIHWPAGTGWLPGWFPESRLVIDCDPPGAGSLESHKEDA